jgi:hypothetical protein
MKSVHALSFALCLVPTVATGGDDGPALAELLQKAGAYASRYEREFTDISAQESYSQKLFQSRNMRLQQARELESDIVFVRLGGDLRWMVFRDTFEVDGKSIRDREARLERLFAKTTTDATVVRAQEILDESARYNVGTMSRNFNLPTLALVFLHPENQARFKFKRKGQDKIEGTPAWAIEYEEKSRPAFIRDGSGTDLFSRGKVWIEPGEGRLLKSEFKVKDANGTFQVEITVHFAPWKDGGLWVPKEMKEMCSTIPPSADRMPGLRGSGMAQNLSNSSEAGEYVETAAVYSGYRAFKVGTTETFREAEPAEKK